jgi:hypothetical protein
MQRLPALVLALATIAAPLVAAPLSALAQPAYPINPGTWEVKTLFLGLVGATDRWCVKPQDISKFLSGPSNHIYHCTYPENLAANGQLHFKGTCNDKHGYAGHLQGDGQYTPTTLRMNASGAFKFHDILLPGSASIDGRFISSDCPAGVKAFKPN